LGAELGTSFPSHLKKFKRRSVTIPGKIFTDHIEFQEYLTADLIPGYRINCDWLIFGILGISWGELSLYQPSRYDFEKQELTSPKFHKAKNEAGLRLGAGVEYQLNSCLSLKLDYCYSEYQKLHAEWHKYDIHFKEKFHNQVIGISIVYDILQ
jgi:opacity protein-like surface antigen